MSLLNTICKPSDRPVIATILGDAGVGKTCLACTFPKTIVIRAEDGLQSIPSTVRPDSFPLVDAVDQLWSQMTTLIKEEHDYQTLIIDSVTALERMFIQHVVDSDPKNPRSINQAMGGYGAGMAAVSGMHQRVRKACGILNAIKNMHIVFVAHADTELIELPDSDPYARYNLRLSKKSQAPYIDDSDLVGFVRLRTYYTGDGDRKKAISDGTREIICSANAASVSKNRFGINEPIVFKSGENPFAGRIPLV